MTDLLSVARQRLAAIRDEAQPASKSLDIPYEINERNDINPHVEGAEGASVVHTEPSPELLDRVLAATRYDAGFLGRLTWDFLCWAGEPTRTRAELPAAGIPDDFASICAWTIEASGLDIARALLAVGALPSWYTAIRQEPS